ncbi:MAG: tRNA glutamyl-Q(34) synthetase GluQRS [Candidatus Avoscillospira sp.]
MTGRFAPSPSGRMHLGNVFSAMMAWLSVRSQDGEMVLRIEDLDPDRCRREYAEILKDDLRWLGLDWDREQIPQSQRTAAYAAEFERLRDLGLVYPCYCSRGELHAASAPHAADGRVLYAGTCRNLTEAQRAAKTKAPAWRLMVPDRVYGFEDGLQGHFEENLARDCGDFLIRRADGVYAYQLAVVTDDGQGGITEVVRGMDLLDSTPRQLYLYELLHLTPPQFSHVPLLVAPDGRRLSKREKDLDLGVLRQNYTPEQLLGRLAHLAGLLDRPESVSARELAGEFSWKKVKKEPVVLKRL